METEKKVKKTHHGHAIAYLRRLKGLTQAELGGLICMSQQAVSGYEGQKVIKDEILTPFAKALNVEIEDIKNMEDRPLQYIGNNTVSQFNSNSPGARAIGGIIEENNTYNFNGDGEYNNIKDSAIMEFLRKIEKRIEALEKLGKSEKGE